eukprot:TRINITY_DN104350_c0_g1_i1.p1 TRINITY_DN104350_c0_g1~~TRINITY_DN104350_c0_g1_i1.p1  ORF type:complete len:267 (-),score=26.03 TRINITY_DN104350_c0_g1_i1:279-1079(-)
MGNKMCANQTINNDNHWEVYFPTTPDYCECSEDIAESYPYPESASTFPGTAHDLFPPRGFEWHMWSPSDRLKDGPEPEFDHFKSKPRQYTSMPGSWEFGVLSREDPHPSHPLSDDWVLRCYKSGILAPRLFIEGESDSPPTCNFHDAETGHIFSTIKHQGKHIVFKESKYVAGIHSLPIRSNVITAKEEKLRRAIQFNREYHEDAAGQQVATVTFSTTATATPSIVGIARWTSVPGVAEVFASGYSGLTSLTAYVLMEAQQAALQW